MSCIIFCIVKQKYRLLATFGSFSRVVNQRCSLESSNPERFVISHLGKSSAGCCQRPAECYHWKPPMAFRNNLIYLDMELRTNIWWSGFFRTYVLNTDVVFVVLYCTVPYYFLLPRYKCCRLISKEGLCRVRIVLLHINVCHNCRWTLVSNSLKARYSLLLVLVTFSAQVWCWVCGFMRVFIAPKDNSTWLPNDFRGI